MVNNQNIVAFINYNYIPFSKSQCVKRLILIWVLSVAICFIGNHNALWAASLGVVNLIASVIFIALIVKLSQSKVSRFLCDGIFNLYVAIILNLASYRFMTLQIGENWILLIILLFLLLVFILIFVFVVFLNIKSDKYSVETNNKRMGLLPFMSGVCGILAAKVFLQDQSQQMVVTLVAFILLILSFMTGIGSINLLKIFLMKKINK